MAKQTEAPNNPLKSTIFTDGEIRGLHRKEAQVVLEFIDYSASAIEIMFLGVSRLLVDESVEGVEVMDASFYWTGSEWVGSFKDDDRQTIFEITYERVELG